METPYYRLSPQQALDSLQSREEGLTAQQARERLEKFGPNTLREEPKKPVWQVFLEQFKDLLVVILIAAALISMLSGNLESTIVIFAVLILNAVLGTVQHCKAEKSLESLKAMSAPSARVLRDGERLVIPSTQLVPGDIVELEAGDMVAADGRILRNYSLKVNESSLTGESEGVEKTDAVIQSDHTALGDRKNLVFSGSLVTYGRALVVVTGTGMNTELGRVADLMNQAQRRENSPSGKPGSVQPPPGPDDSDHLRRGVCPVSVPRGPLRRPGYPGLPHVRGGPGGGRHPRGLKLHCHHRPGHGHPENGPGKCHYEGAQSRGDPGGGVSDLLDKTGTLTQNKMTPQSAYADGALVEVDDLTLSNPVHRRLIQTAVLASDATTDEEKGTAVGDPTEVALIMIGDRMGIEERFYRALHPRLCELAFDSDRKLMSGLHDLNGEGSVLFTKGALDVLLERSVGLLTSDGVAELTQERREQLLAVNQALSSQGLRVLAFAFRGMPGARQVTLEDERDYTSSSG